MSLPHDPFGLVQMPARLAAELDPERARAGRKDRVRRIGRVAERLLCSPDPDDVLVGSALLGALEDGKDLERHHLRIQAPNGSHVTHAVLWREIRDEEPRRPSKVDGA